MERVNQILANQLFRQCLQTISRAEKERVFCRHDMEHFLSVARIMQIQSLEEHLDVDKQIIYATALLHDLGRALCDQTGHHHAQKSGKIAKEILQDCGFTKEEREQICFAIASHNNEQDESPLGRLLRYADHKSRNCFLCPAYEECYWPETKKNQGVQL